MTLQMKDPMKKLTKIRLINWHYFTDETINVNGSVLFSGENASGKSTILDAIQLVLTTNSTKFNPAANEKSKRKLDGYVRCKTGEEGNTYIRNIGAVISYVALEFYEESKDRYFVIGVKLDSPDVEAEITKKWFVIEGTMDSLTFITNGKPSIDKEFTQNGKRIQFETQVSRAKENIKVRLGQLDDNFGDMIIKSMAFRPMDKVKDFINNFILPKNIIQTENLQENIRNLREMQKLINEVKKQINQLKEILTKADGIDEKEYEILVVDILIKIANLERIKEEFDDYKKQKSADEAILQEYIRQKHSIEDLLKLAEDNLRTLDLSLSNNEVGKLIEKHEETIRNLSAEKAKLELSVDEFNQHLSRVRSAIQISQISDFNLRLLISENDPTEEKARELEKIKSSLLSLRDNFYSKKSKNESRIEEINSKAKDLEIRIDELRKNRLVYNDNTTRLLNAINSEFENRRVDSKARVFADLLEINLPEWQDAVEGYLNTQRFNIIVDPEYFDIAANVYDRLKKNIHSVGVVNVKKLMKEELVQRTGTLADAVSSENRYARAYANYLLGRVMRCDDVSELKNHSISITKSCMKYQGHVLSKIDESIYKTPFIGHSALQIQLKNAEYELDTIKDEKDKIEKNQNQIQRIISSINDCNFDQIHNLMSSPMQLKEKKIQIQQIKEDLDEAKKDPTFVDLSIKRDNVLSSVENYRNKLDIKKTDISNKERDIQDCQKEIERIEQALLNAKNELSLYSSKSINAFNDANKRYQDNARTKSSRTIFDNYGPRRQTLINQKEDIWKEMVKLQSKYKEGELGSGSEVIQNYRNDLEKLEKSDLLSYEDKLASIQQECEIEFRENFLAKMRENIDNADRIFKLLNKSLHGIYYGNDSYKFILSANKQRQSIYNMITSNVNIAGENLFTSVFEENYHAEMEELFSKLTDENLNDSKTIEELTDYRSYLDYDIQVVSKEGKTQLFSKTYAEKSGGETQTPYYVAIAASFAQMYSGRETTRIIMLDEAFNNMDEDRIASMMQFLKGQNFQVILAAPPSRMEIIGEYVDSIYLTIRQGNVSVVEEYFYEGL